MTAFRHAPYADAIRPFSIGLKPIAPAGWLPRDAIWAEQITEKRRLLAVSREAVVRSREDTLAARREVLALVRGASDVVCDATPDPDPLVEAALLVPDDLVIMRRAADGWRLVAACLCFPSTWSLAEKFDRPMDAIHADVPGYAGAMAERVARIFDHLPAGEIVERFNWSIYPDSVLHHPEPRSGPRPWSRLASAEAVAAAAFVRIERQTLRRLPDSGDILFTIRVQVDPFAALAGHPDSRRLAAGLIAQLEGLDAAQLAYKNLAAERATLIGALRRWAEPAG
jgi:hypothetical protein